MHAKKDTITGLCDENRQIALPVLPPPPSATASSPVLTVPPLMFSDVNVNVHESRQSGVNVDVDVSGYKLPQKKGDQGSPSWKQNYLG